MWLRRKHTRNICGIKWFDGLAHIHWYLKSTITLDIIPSFELPCALRYIRIPLGILETIPT
jgi:hypothetical protein